MHKQYRSGRWTRRQALWLLFGASSSIGLHACAPSVRLTASPGKLTPVTVGITPWIGCAPLYIAQEKGFFRESGIDLEVRNFTSSFESLPAFSAGRLQIMQVTTPDAVTLASQGTDYRVVGVMDTSSGADAFLARKSVRDISDFKGKQIVVQRGGVGHFLLLQVLAEAGLTESDISIADIEVDAAAAAYQAGNAEIIYTFSPFLEQANIAQPDGRIIYDTSKIPAAIADLYIAIPAFAQEEPQSIEGFLRGIFKGLNFLQTQQSEALEIVAESLDVAPDEVETQLKGVRLPNLQTNLEMLGNPQSELYMLESMNAVAEFLKAQDQIQSIPDLSDAIDLQFLQALS
ncbi:ABC transporter substrate-binding protein [Oculatella sp. LEGE 06141]|uniref:ABC transporter substrate-binding protein n=1 Tax=Oculatella sp. LEGE 06141 TaxID=1828648 RepID=UPI001882FA67|nr:ABC transporter substrate-binding protein [Oculatella sp. LEGE 06141]MBE9180232.1 ABC transporter substrate-binding protein [Oculatella sp. LEGE 06141]